MARFVQKFGTLFGVLAVAASAQATVLTFDIDGLANFQVVNQNYGDNVTATTMGGFSYGDAEGFTPDITVEYGDTRPALWNTGYGDLTNVLFEDWDGTGVLTLTFTAGPGFGVALHSFDLGAYTPNLSSDPTIASVKVFNSANAEVFAQSDVPVSITTRTPFVFSPPLVGDVLRIEIDARNLGSLNDDIAIDNVTFSQVPEPITGMMLLAGLGAVCYRRRCLG